MDRLVKFELDRGLTGRLLIKHYELSQIQFERTQPPSKENTKKMKKDCGIA
jgi:hypothetical protein